MAESRPLQAGRDPRRRVRFALQRYFWIHAVSSTFPHKHLWLESHARAREHRHHTPCDGAPHAEPEGYVGAPHSRLCVLGPMPVGASHEVAL